MQHSVSPARVAAILAAGLFAAAVAGFGAGYPAYSNLAHPVAALGASGVPAAAAFNAIGFVAPGLLAAFVTQLLRGRMSAAPFMARLGVQLLTLAALAFAALGFVPLDSHDLLSASSRAHAAAWTAWWIAFAAGSALLAAGMRGTPQGTRGAAVFACSAATVMFAIVLPVAVPVGLSQRLAFAAWLLATVLLAPSRGAASSPGSSATGRG